MGSFVVGFDDIDGGQVALVGGKGAHLGELARIDGVRVPPGFCVTTEAFRLAIAPDPSIDELLDRAARLRPDDRDGIRSVGEALRARIDSLVVPEEVAAAIARALDELGPDGAYAVRSSATAEDLPTASFAGQHDTYLNVVGAPAVVEHVARCWASLHTERAVTYRLQHAFDHRKVEMAVVVQRQVLPEASGILFTADPVTSNRKVVSIDASFGLGEALVSGLVNADVAKVRDGEIVEQVVATKRLAVLPAPGGGTHEVAIERARQDEPALTDAQIVRLAALGRRIEAHLGRPQDIEWCLAGDDLLIVQSRPITTLFPIPEVGDDGPHVFISVGHLQMMTDPIKPLGLSVWQLTAGRPMFHAAGRLFVEVAAALAAPASRDALVAGFRRTEPLTGDALAGVVARGDLVPPAPDPEPGEAGVFAPPPATPPPPLDADPALVAALVDAREASLAALVRDIDGRTGEDLLDFILTDVDELKRLLAEPASSQVVMGGMEATWWLNDQLLEWLGEKNAADTLTLSVPGNVTAEMGLALLDVADAIRPHPEVVAFLEGVEGDDFLDALPALAGGPEALAAVEGYLDRYGMRCVGEIDLTRPRWREHPSALVPAILGNVRNFSPGAAARHFEEGRVAAAAKAADVLARLRALPDGEEKAEQTERMIERVRAFNGFREYPKYVIVNRYFVYKQALLAEADRLVEAGVLDDREDVFFLTFAELHDVVRRRRVDRALVAARRSDFETYGALSPPRVLTSDGEVFTGAYRRDDVPTGALVGLPVSVGTVEGRARVVLDVADADLEPGDILVTTSTDPSWSPLFVAIAGLVTEVGGQMTHGAVIAREYGLPAVVGVEHATAHIPDGRRIRVNGTDGFVELLPPI